jgi:hypothetical protein
LHLHSSFHRESVLVLVESRNGQPGRETSAAGFPVVERTGGPVLAGTERAGVEREIHFAPDHLWAFIPAQDTAIARAPGEPAVDKPGPNRTKRPKD